ncbi:CTAG/Pcc1 family [Polychytrium aggregatum]|uniref:CTAG/Pcc1 family n=1 Tax=Polychytrium aggregatum TaxID=110093 RepID=UPI0022FDF1C1|nr:CTAG/Pcc1 family [Polychytrium aggregatum]KAI9209884.1 CTAG/Pcc1 family [Polychytrium aggregatum]
MANQLQISVPFPNAALAQIALKTLSVDRELKSDQLQREMRVEGHYLYIDFKASTARLLRASVSGFFDMLILVCRTMDEFAHVES